MEARALDFIEKANVKHNNKYDYSNVNYVNSEIKVKIICSKHGNFEQTPRGHLRGGCFKCGREATNSKTRKNRDVFVQQAQSIHGDKYDYSKTVYINSHTKITIICRLHGNFEQVPPSHLSGHGCPLCAGWNKTNQIFIEQARKVHGEKYDYSKVIYMKATEKVIIICPKHGEFMPSPNNHLNGKGCRKCKVKNSLPRVSHEEFMTNIKAIHGDKYDYSKTKYTGSRKGIIIICKLHGEFTQIAKNHLHGAGCWKCGGSEKLTTEAFIERAKTMHNNKYDYSNVDYINMRTKIRIICHAKFDFGGKDVSHGIFEQVPYSHLRGVGCPKCNLCPSCGIWLTYKGRNCEYCDPLLQNNHYTKTKEYAVVTYLRENLPDHDFIHNKSVGKGCTNGHLFPDIRYDQGFYNLIVEVDEHKHRGADYKCDQQRMYDIIAKLGQPCIFIRYNPDGKKSDKNTLLDKIKQYIEIDPGNKHYAWDEFGFYCEYLFY